MNRTTWLAGMALLTSACGGGGSDVNEAPTGSAPPSEPGAPVQGLALPDNFSVLSATNEGAQHAASKPQGVNAKPGLAGTLAAGTGSFAKLYTDPDTDYSTAETHVWVYDRSMESLDLINEIVCYMGQTAASEMVNQGPYIAMVNEERCRKGENGSSSGETGQSNGGGGVEFSNWIVDSQRADNNSDQRVRLWVPDPGEGGPGFGPQHILVEVIVSEGESDSRPFGSFVMNFKGVMNGDSMGMPGMEIETMRGMLATVDNPSGAPQFRFINLGGDALALGTDMGFGFEEAASVRLADAEGTSGLALTRRAESWNFEGPFGLEQGEEEETFAIEYNTTHFLSSLDNNGDSLSDELMCRARDEFDVRVWRYNLYHQDDGDFRGRAVTGGQRVELNAGFPFSYDSVGDGIDDAYGWMGYHGLWTESDSLLADGQTIHSFDYDSDATIEYTVRVAPGRLIRRTANQELLSSFIGDEFQFWGEHPTLAIFGQWLVTVDQNLDFQITSTFDWDDTGPVFSNTVDHDGDPQTAEVAVAATLAPQDKEVVWLWSDSLGGNVVYTHDVALASQSRTVTFFAEEYVTAEDTVLFPSGTTAQTLYCYEQCLVGGLTQTDVDTAQSPQDLYHPYLGQPLTYTLSSSGGKVVLIDDTTGGVVSATQLALQAVGHEWGINTGEMLTAPLADPNQPWLVYDEPISYRWETGSNVWNVMVTATDVTGATVNFDRPLEISYVHLLANDANNSAGFDGKRFLLHYGGAGDLHGFPWLQEGESDYWYPAVTLADGTVLSVGGNSFVVKALEREQSMRQVDAAECIGLDADGAYLDPGLALPSVNDIGTVGFGLNDRPQVDGPPAVIEGEVQGSST